MAEAFAVSKGIVAKINAHYGMNLIANITQYDTSVLGYFNTMKLLVDTGV